MNYCSSSIRRRIRASGLLLVAFLVSIALVSVVSMSRVEAVATSGITVSPVEVSLSTGTKYDMQKSVITIRNDYSEVINFEASIGGMQLLSNGSLTPTGDPDPGLSEALVVAPSVFSLKAGESIGVQLSLKDTSALSPGGHYASLLIKQKETATKQLLLTPAISVAVFIVKEDGAIRSVNISNVAVNGGLFRLPTTTTANFKNDGNVGIVPRASVTVSDNKGRAVATGVMNPQSFTVWPDKTLKLQTSLEKIGSSWLPSKYSVQVTYRYDGSDDQHTVIIRRWFIPPAFSIGIIFVGVFIFLVRKRVITLGLYIITWPKKRTKPARQQPELKSVDGIMAKKHETVSKIPQK